jgi:hypothetical protein
MLNNNSDIVFYMRVCFEGIEPEDSISGVVILSEGRHSPVEMLQTAIKDASFRENGSDLNAASVQNFTCQ